MKIYVIVTDNKIGITIHEEAFPSKDVAMSKCKTMAAAFAKFVNNGKINPKIKTGESSVSVLNNGTCIKAYHIKEVTVTEQAAKNENRYIGSKEINYDEDTCTIHPHVTEQGKCFIDFEPENYDIVCYVQSSVFDNHENIVITEDYHPDGCFTLNEIADVVASCYPGNDVESVRYWAKYILKKGLGRDVLQHAKTLPYNSTIKMLFNKAEKIYFDPYNEDDEPGNVKILRFDSEECILVTDDNGIEQEVTLSETYRISDKRCPLCGEKLFHEKWANTEEHYPYVCFGCDENFYEFETKD